ncbi:MAG: hypothetical protein QM756_42805 [Polyangiaceae bacterium]
MRRSYSPLLGLALTTCAPSFDDRGSRISEPRVLAVVAEPAEARPSAQVRFTAKLALPIDALPTTAEWAFCEERPAVGDPRSIAESCLDESGIPIRGTGFDVSARIPSNACATFGPEPPPGALRPADPDATGGFYQPVRIRAWGRSWVHLFRIRCELPNAPSDAARALAEAYEPNLAPQLDALSLSAVRAGETLTLRASWASESAESFVWLPPGGSSVQAQREWLRVRWYSSDGQFGSDVTGRDANDAATNSDNTWRAPATNGPVTLWLVLSDARGASDVIEANVVVE